MNGINKKQNTEEILVLLFSQRKYYDKAELKKYSIWIATLIVFLMNNILIFKINLTTRSVIIAAITMIIAIVNSMLQRNIELGATTKELIDRKLFGFSTNERYLSFIKEEFLQGKAREIRYKFDKAYQIQSTSTGEDKTRGVKEWYLDVKNLQMENAILKCQKENVWWDKKLSNVYIWVLSSMLIIVIIIFLIFNLNSTISTVGVNLLSAMPIIAIIFNEFRLYYKFIILNTDMSINLEYLDNEQYLTNDKLEDLQMKIYKRRLLGFGAPSIFHKVLSFKFHKIIKETRVS